TNVFSGVPSGAQPNETCTEEITSTIELAPGQCKWVTQRFANEAEAPGRPCDSACCKANQQNPGTEVWKNCNTHLEPSNPVDPPSGDCTKILDATVKVIGWINPNGRPTWQAVAGQPTIAAITNGVVTVGAETNQCQVFNFCNSQDPHFKQWDIGTCDPRL
ncbi:MAG TPA: hypothetical protein VFP58_00900, partial [Candidatus Eisenbacteria bacterium]|nr:hypothetical protein [Candidatus Eisenbacteria bacterium]